MQTHQTSTEQLLCKDMDWYSWLSKSSLNPSLVYEYGLLFARNELEPCDAAHFDHDFLKSMGVSIAKHRLEILKLAKKESKKRYTPQFMARAMAVTKKCLSKCMHTLVQHPKKKLAIVIVPRICNGADDIRGGVAKKSKKMMLMITDGSAKNGGPFSVSQSTSLMVPNCYDGDDDCSVSEGEMEIKWDSMFQDLKPT